MKLGRYEIRVVEDDLLSLWVPQGDLAVVVRSITPVLKCCQVKVFELHLCLLSFFKIEL